MWILCNNSLLFTFDIQGWLITGLNLVLGGGETDNTTEASAATESVTRVESEASLDGT